MKLLFLDESGDHDLTNIDPEYPVFVLGGIIVDEAYASGELTEKLNEFKQDLFGTTNIIIHTADIIRNRNGFERLKSDKTFRAKFMEKLNNLMLSLEYKVVACAIKKQEHVDKYVSAADPYLFSLDVVTERFVFELGGHTGQLIAEKRNKQLDAQLLLAWRSLELKGTSFLTPTKFKARIPQPIDLRAKAENIAGLQIADLVVSPIGRHVIGKPDRKDWEIVRSKFRTSFSGKWEGYGLITLPKK